MGRIKDYELNTLSQDVYPEEAYEESYRHHANLDKVFNLEEMIEEFKRVTYVMAHTTDLDDRITLLENLMKSYRRSKA